MDESKLSKIANSLLIGNLDFLGAMNFSQRDYIFSLMAQAYSAGLENAEKVEVSDYDCPARLREKLHCQLSRVIAKYQIAKIQEEKFGLDSANQFEIRGANQEQERDKSWYIDFDDQM